MSNLRVSGLLNHWELDEISVSEVEIDPEAKAKVTSGEDEENMALVKAGRFAVNKKSFKFALILV